MSKRHEQADRGTKLASAYRAGDLSRRAFCEQAGIAAVSTLDYYLRRENERLKKKQRLLPVVVTVKPEEGKTPEITVRARNGRRIEVRRGFDPELLLRVLNALERVRDVWVGAGVGRGVKSESGDIIGGTWTVRSIVETQYEPCACSPAGKMKRVSLPYAPGGSPIWTEYTYL